VAVIIIAVVVKTETELEKEDLKVMGDLRDWWQVCSTMKVDILTRSREDALSRYD
jgi:hypothetical protein